jgi:hypothetical protein
MSYSSPGAGFRTWHVVVFLGFVVLVIDIASMQMMGQKTNQFAFVSEPPRPLPKADQPQPAELPPGTKWVTLSANDAVRNLVGPGVRVSVLAARGIGDTRKVFRLLLDVEVVSVDTSLPPDRPDVRVNLALTDKESRAVELAQARGWTLTMKLRPSGKKPEHDIDEVIAFLEGTPLNEPEVAPPPRPVNENR